MEEEMKEISFSVCNCNFILLNCLSKFINNIDTVDNVDLFWQSSAICAKCTDYYKKMFLPSQIRPQARIGWWVVVCDQPLRLLVRVRFHCSFELLSSLSIAIIMKTVK